MRMRWALVTVVAIATLFFLLWLEPWLMQSRSSSPKAGSQFSMWDLSNVIQLVTMRSMTKPGLMGETEALRMVDAPRRTATVHVRVRRAPADNGIFAVGSYPTLT
jgi:hypothetical protein